MVLFPHSWGINAEIGTGNEKGCIGLKALMVHEYYGHGIKNFSTISNHYRAYLLSIDSKYWIGTTKTFKAHTVNVLWRTYSRVFKNRALPSPYDSIFWLYQTTY